MSSGSAGKLYPKVDTLLRAIWATLNIEQNADLQSIITNFQHCLRTSEQKEQSFDETVVTKYEHV